MTKKHFTAIQNSADHHAHRLNAERTDRLSRISAFKQSGMVVLAALLMSLGSSSSGFAKTTPSKTPAAPKPLTATLKTSMGVIKLKLFKETAPKTVENFVGLATGKKEWKDPKTEKTVKGKSLYAGTIFHRVIPDFMIQGGDPLGNGTGGPGYQFEDETKPTDSFDKPGILAMANAGPNTNGSQFFITVKPTPWLNGKHTIFGEVIEGMDIVEKIVSVPKDASDRPEKPVKIEKVTIK